MEATGSLVLADDSGLEVDYLNKEPGVYSARYMGENTSYRIKNQIILDRLHGVPDIRKKCSFRLRDRSGISRWTSRDTPGND